MFRIETILNNQICRIFIIILDINYIIIFFVIIYTSLLLIVIFIS